MSLEERLANVQAIGEARRRRNMASTLSELRSAQQVVKDYRKAHSEHGSMFGFVLGLFEGSKSREK